MMKKIVTKGYAAPCGELIIGSYEGQICLCDWRESGRREATDRRIRHMLQAEYVAGESPLITETIRQLEEYFARQRKEFDLPLLPVGTDFQLSVWRSLQQIPYGTTITYATQAQRMQQPSAIRAIANANGSNALSILIPCHRVIGSNRKLTGYAGGLDTKRYLLQLELQKSLFF